MKRRNNNLTEEEIVAWADSIKGIPTKETARRLGVHRNTILNYCKRVQAFVGDRIDLDNYKLPLFELYPLALKSLIANLEDCDVQMTIQFFKGLGIFVDKQEYEDVGKFSDEELDAISQRIVQSAQSRLAASGEDRPGEATATA